MAGKGIKDLFATLNLVDKGFSSGIEKASGKLNSFALKAGVATGAAAALGAVFAGYKFTQGVVNTTASFEMLSVRLETITGSSKKAEQSLAWIEKFTAKTPYELNQVADAFTKLAAYGIDAQSKLGMLGDTAAAMGKDLNQSVEAYADALTGEFERLKEFGVKAKTVGDDITFSWRQNGADQAATVKKTQQEIGDQLEKIFSRFDGGMEKMTSTWSGMTSNMSDAWTSFQKDVGESGAFDVLKDAAKELLEEIDKLKKNGQLEIWANKASIAIVDGMYAAAKSVDFLSDAIAGVRVTFGSLVKGFAEFSAGRIYDELTKSRGLVVSLKKEAEDLADSLKIDKKFDEKEGYIISKGIVDDKKLDQSLVKLHVAEDAVSELEKKYNDYMKMVKISNGYIDDQIDKNKDLDKIFGKIYDRLDKAVSASESSIKNIQKNGVAVEELGDALQSLPESKPVVIDLEWGKDIDAEFGELLGHLSKLDKRVEDVFKNINGIAKDTLSDVFGDSMRGELDSFADYFESISDRMTDTWSSMLSTMLVESKGNIKQMMSDMSSAEAGFGLLSSASSALQSGDRGVVAGSGIGAAFGGMFGGLTGASIGSSLGSAVGGMFGGDADEKRKRRALEREAEAQRKAAEAIERAIAIRQQEFGLLDTIASFDLSDTEYALKKVADKYQDAANEALKLGDGIELVIEAREREMQAIREQATSGFDRLVDDIKDWQQGIERRAWNQDDYEEEFAKITNAIADLDISDPEYNNRSLELLDDQFEVLKAIEGLNADQLSEQRRLADAYMDAVADIDELLTEFSVGSMAPVQSLDAAIKHYDSLLDKAVSGNTEDLSEFAKYINDYVDLMTAAGVDYQQTVDKVTGDLGSIKDVYADAADKNTQAINDNISSLIDNEGGLQSNTLSLDGLSQTLGEAFTTGITELMDSIAQQREVVEQETANKQAAQEKQAWQSVSPDISAYTFRDDGGSEAGRLELIKFSEDTLKWMQQAGIEESILKEVRDAAAAAYMGFDYSSWGAPKIQEAIKEALSGQTIYDIPQFGDGGFVSSKTLAIVGEKSPEMITPVSTMYDMLSDQAAKIISAMPRANTLPDDFDLSEFSYENLIKKYPIIDNEPTTWERSDTGKTVEELRDMYGMGINKHDDYGVMPELPVSPQERYGMGLLGPSDPNIMPRDEKPIEIHNHVYIDSTEVLHNMITSLSSDGNLNQRMRDAIGAQ